MNDFIGVDIAKKKFDACFLKEDGEVIQRVFDNTASGWKTFVRWIKEVTQQIPWITMESTGHHSELLAEYLVSEGFKVSVVKPVQIKYFAKVKLSRNKNDRVDAKIIAEYARLMMPRVFEPRTSTQKYIRELIQLEDTLKIQKTQLALQLSCTQSEAIKEEFETVLKTLEERLKALGKQITLEIEKDTKLARMVELITTIKGFGKLSAYRFLAYLPDLSLFKSAKQLAAFIGVTPKQKESGQYKGKTPLSKLGNARLRRVLYMPALSAKRSNEALQPFVKRLKNNGLSPKAIVCAVMRKLVHIIWGMLKNDSPFDPKLV